MSAPFGMYGGYKRESTESRALGSITSDSYDYRDQAKFLSKMAGDVSYMAAYMRKMQRGIDSANENFVQQIQSLLNDFMVLLAGNGDTGLDFGDLKYVLQAIGALFGFGDGPLPINLFAAAWHFFSTYILPVSNFQEAIEMIVDGLIAGVLDLFGEVPIVGQALQQFAVILSELRDIVMPLLEAVQGLFDAIGYAFDDDLGPFGDLMTALNKAFGAITEPVAEALAPLLAILATWTAPLMDGLTYIVQAVTNIINTLTNGIHDIQYYAESGFDPLQMLLDIIETLIDNGILAVLDAGNIVGTLLASVIPALDASKIVSGIFNALQIPNLDAGKIVSGIFNALRIPGLDASKITSGQFAQAMVNITSIAANWITGVLNSLNIPSLDASKITSGQFSQSLIQNLGADLDSIDDAIQQVIADAAQALSDFTDFLSGGWQPLLDGVKGATGGGISDIINRLVNITSGGLFDAAKLSAVTGTAPQSLITDLPTDLGSLQTTLNQIGEIFENNVVTPVNSIVSTIKDWWNAWFGGGSSNAIPLSQKGAANGVAPLNSSTKVATSYLETNVANGIPKLTGSGKLDLTYVETNGNNQLLKLDGSAKVPGANMPDLGSTYIAAGEKGAVNGVAPLNANAVVPLAYLPEEVGGSGGTGDGRPYVVLSKLASQSIPNSTQTLVTGWVQFGTASVTFENGTKGRWKFGLPGLWLIQFRAVWSTGATSGAQAAGITRQVLIAPTGSSGTPVELAVVTDFINPNGALTVGLNNYAACGGGITQRVSDWAATTSAGTITYGDDDWFGLKVRQNKGSAHNLIGVDPPNPETTTTVICTYLGAS